MYTPLSPDCFKHAAAAIEPRCDELAANEESRVQLSIELTLCEISTARHGSPPLECTQQGKKRVARDCVEALSRSAQFWSSYSGYIRDIPQLCVAYKKWNEVDLAKEIYTNITSSNAILLNYLTRRAVYEENLFTDWDMKLKVHFPLFSCLGMSSFAYVGFRQQS
ncbi:hypothetical protein DL96DRAFT_1468749 [Flagelloscypha sp. PMI_526]|nr:hypothetical protein DL96DRAFT_1468749 [Flagelloscypha sp. PMI_526]